MEDIDKVRLALGGIIPFLFTQGCTMDGPKRQIM